MRIAWFLSLLNLALIAPAFAQVDEVQQESCNIPLLCGKGPRIQFEIKIKPRIKTEKPKVRPKPKAQVIPKAKVVPKVKVVIEPRPKPKVVVKPKPREVAVKPEPRVEVAPVKKPVPKIVVLPKPRPQKKPKTKAVPQGVEPSWLGLPEIPVVTLRQGDLAPIQNQYILTLNPAGFAAQGLDLATINQADLAQRLVLAPDQLRSVQRRFMLTAIVTATPEQAAALAQNPLISELNNDSQIKAAAVKRRLSWGLDRLDAPTLPLDGKFERADSSSATRIYVFDTAIDDRHPDLVGVIKARASFVAPPPSATKQIDEKCREHGTEMASLIAGSFTGTAPKANLIELVVLPCGRSTTGAVSSIIEAGEWLLLREEKIGDAAPIIANMSLAGERSKALNMAVKILTDNGVVVVAAAGNEGKDACRYSPASAPTAITVAATTSSDDMPGFSNRGACVDIHAPGRLLTAITENERGYVAVNGTSGAAAMVSGLLARSLTKRGPEAATTWLASAAVPSQFWRQDATDQKLIQASDDWRGNCRVAVAEGVALRIDPRASAQRIAVLAAGSLVTVQSAKSDWVKVMAPGGFEGWLIAKEKDMETLRALDSEEPCERS
jgi:aqualysin 1